MCNLLITCRFLLVFLVVSRKKRIFAVTNIKCKNMKDNIYDIKMVARYIALSLLTKQMTVSAL